MEKSLYHSCDINFEYYKVFYYCARYKNVTKTAEMLCISQPAVTKTIRKLEESYGCPLFIRSKNGVSLTAKGEELYKVLRFALELIFKMEDDHFNSFKDDIEGTVHTACSEVACNVWLIPRMRGFSARYPNIRVKVNYLASYAVDYLEQDENCDFLLMTTPLNINEEMKQKYEIIELAKFEDGFVCGVEYRHLAEKIISVKELEKYPLVLMEPTSSTNMFIKQIERTYKVDLSPTYVFGTLAQLKAAIKQNLGIGTSPYAFISDEIKNGQMYCLHISEALPMRRIVLVYRKNKPLSKVAKVFLNTICVIRGEYDSL